MSTPTPLYTPRPDRPMRVAGFMSGSGTNLVKIIEKQAELEQDSGGAPFRVEVIFTDNQGSNAIRISEDFGIPLVVEDILAFYRSRGHDTKKDLSLRAEFDRKVVELMAPYSVDAIVLAGYMSIVTKPLLEAFPGRIINVHPADLLILEGGRRKYTGDNAVRDAILAGEQVVRSSTHIVREEVDGGEVLMVSVPVPVELPPGLGQEGLVRAQGRQLLDRLAAEHQERLKEKGDWVILPRTLECLSRGQYVLDDDGRVCLDGESFADPETV